MAVDEQWAAGDPLLLNAVARRTRAHQALSSLGGPYSSDRDGFAILEEAPVMNELTIYSCIICPSSGLYRTKLQFPPGHPLSHHTGRVRASLLLSRPLTLFRCINWSTVSSTLPISSTTTSCIGVSLQESCALQGRLEGKGLPRPAGAELRLPQGTASPSSLLPHQPPQSLSQASRSSSRRGSRCTASLPRPLGRSRQWASQDGA